MDDKIIPHLVARFLSWKLPPDFRPDAGISFAPEYNNGTPEGGRHEPSGTNLLNAEQAFAMFRHVLDHPAVTALPERELLAEAMEALTEIARDDIGGLQAIYNAHEFDPGDYDKDTCVARLRSWMENEATYLMRRISYHRTRARTAANKIRAALTQEKQT